MGAWGLKTFENDDASDWVHDLQNSSDLSLIESTLQSAQSEYLEAPEGCHVLAAAEAILALRGTARDGIPEGVSAWASRHRSLDTTALTSLAVSSLEKVLSEDSELKELWEESAELDRWKSDVLGIKSALEG